MRRLEAQRDQRQHLLELSLCHQAFWNLRNGQISAALPWLVTNSERQLSL